MLPAAGKQRLLVVAGKRLPAVEPQPAGAGGQAVIRFGRQGCAQRLKGRGQVLVRRKGHALAVVEKLPDIPCRFRRRNDQIRVVCAVGKAWPAVHPLNFLQGSFAPQRAVSALRQGAGADVGDVPLAADLDKTGVTTFLQRVGGIVPRGQKRKIGRILPRTVQRFGACDRGGVQVARAARRAEQVIPAVFFEDLRSLADA